MNPEHTSALPSFHAAAGTAAAAGFMVLAIAAAVWAQTAPAPTLPLFTLSADPISPVAGEPVTLEAVPQNFTASSTVFTWYRNGARLDAVSGLGRSAITMPTEPGTTEVIQVKVVAAPGGSFTTAEETALITTVPGPAQLEQKLRTAQSEFSLQATTITPDPGEAVTVEVVTFAFDKNLASYQWSVNGVLQREASGRGQYRIELPGGREGELRNVSVTLTTPDGTTRTKSITIRAVSAPLYWWADTGVPYWYKGKALPSPSSRVTVLALPNISSPGELIYQWQFNGGIIPKSSGLGKSTFSFAFQFPVREQIEVMMKNAAGTSKSAGLTLAPVEPRVGIYTVPPGRGVRYERQATEFSAPSGETYDFLAVPFFFPTERASSLRFSWKLNGNDVTKFLDKPWLITLKSNAGETSMDNTLGVDVTDPARDGEHAANSIRADFR